MKIIVAAVLFLLAGCIKRQTPCCTLTETEMIRTQTQCADAWGYGSNNDETVTKLSAYITEKNYCFQDNAAAHR